MGSSVLNPGAMFLRFVTKACFLFLAPAWQSLTLNKPNLSTATVGLTHLYRLIFYEAKELEEKYGVFLDI